MTQTPFIDEVMQRANDTLRERMGAVEDLAKARLTLEAIQTETQEQLAELQRQIDARLREAEREHTKAFKAAQRQGWTIEELRKMGLPEPATRRRAQRRTKRQTQQATTPEPAPAQESSNDDPNRQH